MHLATLGLLFIFAASPPPAFFEGATPSAAAPALDDTCSFNPKFEMGRRLVYKYTSLIEHLPPKTETPPTENGEPQTPIRSYAIEMTLRLSVLGVDEQGAATFAVLPDDIVIDTKTAELDVNAGFTRKQAEAKSPLPEGAGFLPRLSLALARSAIRMDVRADGTISDITGLEDVYQMAEKEGSEAKRVVGPLAPDAIKRNLAAMFRIDRPEGDAPAAFPARKAGDTWELVDRALQPGGREIVGVTKLTLESCTPDRATIRGSSTMTVAPIAAEPGKEPPKPDPSQPVPTIEEQSDTLTVIWNPTTGVLVERTRDSLMGVSAQIGAERRNSMRIRTRTTFKLIESP